MRAGFARCRSRSRVCLAMTSSSFVGMTHAVGPDPVDIRGPPSRLAASSRVNPAHARPAITSARVATSFSPMPGREDQSVDAAERRDKRSDFADDAIDEQFDGKSCPRFRRRLRRAEPACRSRCPKHQAARTWCRARALPPRALASSPAAYRRSPPASTAPLRVPIGRPSRAENPMVVATLAPPLRAHRLEPLPRWATITRPSARRGSYSLRTDAM